MKMFLIQFIYIVENSCQISMYIITKIAQDVGLYNRASYLNAF